jgi:hypothetical protein
MDLMEMEMKRRELGLTPGKIRDQIERKRKFHEISNDDYM